MRVVQTTGDPWGVLEYEVKMFDATYKIFFTRSTFTELSPALKNAVEEVAVLHTRNLCEIFPGPHKKDDIRLAHLLQGWPRHPRHTKITAKNKKLRKRYPKPLFDRQVMHPTHHRGMEYNYEQDLADLYPLIQDEIAELDDELESLTGKRFNLQFVGPTYQRTVFWA
jgi:hypothetical protein